MEDEEGFVNLEMVKKEIRALLISRKHGLTPKQLNSDYLRTMGRDLPYRNFGYKDCLSFVKTMPDVAKVCMSLNKAVLYGVADSKTKKIQNLVSKQRTSKSEKLVSQWTESRQVTKQAATASTKPVIPERFKQKLKELMLSFPNGISLKDFNESFAKRFQHYIAYRNWGFDSVESMIRSVPDVLHLNHDKVRNVKTVTRVALQLTGLSDLNGEGTVKPPMQIINWQYLNKQKEEEEEKRREKEEEEKRRKEEGIPPFVWEEPTKSEREDRERLEKKKSLHTIETSPVLRRKILSQLAAPEPPQKKPEVPRQIAARVKQLLQANKRGIWISRFLMEYRKRYGVVINVSDWGFSSCSHMLHSLPCCAMARPDGAGDWLVYLRGTTPPKIASNRMAVPSAYLSEQLVWCVHRVLKDHLEKGVAVEKFAKMYKSLFGDDLPVIELGFSTTFELLAKVPGLEMVRPPKGSSVMVFSINPPPPEKKEGPEKPISTGAAADWKEKMGMPQPSVYSKVPLPEACLTRYRTIYVSHVTSPGDFYVQLIGTETSQALEGLQQDMTNFYSSQQGQSYTVEDVYPGFPCCATFEDGYYYRAEVEDLVCPDVVRIRYIDYGNVYELPTTSVRRAKPHYLTLPAQAVQCRLSHMKPAGSAWSWKAKRLFDEITKNKPLVCLITAVKNRLASLIVVDTTTERDVVVGDVLVEQTLGTKTPDTRKDEMGMEHFKLETPFVPKEGELPQVRIPKDVESFPDPSVKPADYDKQGNVVRDTSPATVSVKTDVTTRAPPTTNPSTQLPNIQIFQTNPNPTQVLANSAVTTSSPSQAPPTTTCNPNTILQSKVPLLPSTPYIHAPQHLHLSTAPPPGFNPHPLFGRPLQDYTPPAAFQQPPILPWASGWHAMAPTASWEPQQFFQEQQQQQEHQQLHPNIYQQIAPLLHQPQFTTQLQQPSTGPQQHPVAMSTSGTGLSTDAIPFQPSAHVVVSAAASENGKVGSSGSRSSFELELDCLSTPTSSEAGDDQRPVLEGDAAAVSSPSEGKVEVCGSVKIFASPDSGLHSDDRQEEVLHCNKTGEKGGELSTTDVSEYSFKEEDEWSGYLNSDPRTTPDSLEDLSEMERSASELAESVQCKGPESVQSKGPEANMCVFKEQDQQPGGTAAAATAVEGNGDGGLGAKLNSLKMKKQSLVKGMAVIASEEETDKLETDGPLDSLKMSQPPGNSLEVKVGGDEQQVQVRRSYRGRGYMRGITKVVVLPPATSFSTRATPTLEPARVGMRGKVPQRRPIGIGRGISRGRPAKSMTEQY